MPEDKQEQVIKELIRRISQERFADITVLLRRCLMFQALGDTLIVRVIYQSISSNIIIPGSAQEFKQYYGQVYGEVMSVGPRFGLKFAGDPLRRGDKIIWTRHEGIRFRYDRELYLKLKERWVLAKINNEAI